MSNLDVTLRVSLNADGTVEGAKVVAGEFDKIGGATERAGERATKAMDNTARQIRQGLLAVTAAAGAALLAVTRSSINVADETAKSAQKIGVTVEALSTLRYAADRSGVSAQSLQDALVRVSVGADDAARGTGKAADAFSSLGVSVTNTDGSLKTSDTLLREVATRLAGMDDGIRKTALAVDIFGRSGTELIPLLNQGAEGIEKLEDRARSLGLELDTGTAQQAERFNDLMADLGSLTRGFGNDIARELLPTLSELTEQFVSSGATARNSSGIAEGFATVLKFLAGAALTAKDAVQGLVNILAASIDTILAAGRAVDDLRQRYLTIGGVMRQVRGEAEPLGAVFERLSVRTRSSWTSAATGLGDAWGNISATWRTILGPAATDAADAVSRASRAADTFGATVERSRESTSRAGRAAREAAADYRDFAKEVNASYVAANQLQRGNQSLDVQLRDMQERLAGLTTAQRAFNRALEEANVLYAQALAVGPPTAEAQAAYEERLRQVRELYDLQMELDASEELAASAQRAADDSARAWRTFAEDLVDAFARGTRGVKDLFRRLLQDLLRQWASSQLLRAMGSFFGGSVPGIASAAGMGNGSQLSAMFGQSGGLAWLGNSPMAQQALGYAPYAAAAAGGLYGFSNRGGSNGSGGSLAAGAAYGYAGYALGTVATGALLGAGAGAATGVAGAAAGGALAGGAGAAAAIPVVGWIVAALAAIDALSGGKLFGTRFRPESATSTLSIGEDGASASTSLTEVRNRSLFRGRQWRTSEIAPGDEAIEAATQLWMAISDTMTRSARRLRAEAPEMLEAAIRTVTEFDKKGRQTGQKMFVDVLGRSWEEATAELAATRITAEAIIATIDSAMGNVVPAVGASASRAIEAGIERGIEGGDLGDQVADIIKSATGAVQGEASALAERWRGDAEQLMAGAQFLLAVASDIRAGFDLLGTGTLSPILALVEELAAGGESLEQTYARLAGSAQLLEQALGLSGAGLDLAREEFVRFAADITDAAGGLDRAAALWRGYFQRFFSPEELLDFEIGQARTGARGLLDALGLDLDALSGEAGLAEFRRIFTELLPTLSADAVVQWLEAANALGDIVGLEAQRTQVLEEQAAAIAAYTLQVRDLRDELESAGMSEFALQMRDISRWSDEAITALNQAARAAGMQAAAEEDLALVHQVAAQRAAAAIAQLQAAASDLVAELYDTPLDAIDAQIREIEAAQRGSTASQVGAINEVGAAARGVYQAQLSALQNIRTWLDGQLLGDVSSLTPEERLAEARRQFDAAAEAAAGGDVEALQRITQLADLLLREERAFSASGQQFTDTEAYVRERLQALLGMQLTEPVPAGAPGLGGAGGLPGGSVTPELQALYAQRDALLDEQMATQRAELLRQLGTMVRELIQATGQPLAEVAESIGLNLTRLAADLGINLDELSLETATSLTALARQLGVDVAELAASVGADLGQLADRQSLLNQALDETLALVPEEFRSQLAGPLDAIRRATTDADATSAVEEAEAAIRAMPHAVRDLLAPFFTGISPSPVVTELTTLRDINATAFAQLEVLGDIRALLDRIAEASSEQALPSFDVGTSFVPRTGPALIHRGETILPAAVADFARRSGLTLGPAAGGDSAPVVAELRALRQETAAGQRDMSQRLERLEAAQRDGSERLAAEQRRVGDKLALRS